MERGARRGRRWRVRGDGGGGGRGGDGERGERVRDGGGGTPRGFRGVEGQGGWQGGGQHERRVARPVGQGLIRQKIQEMTPDQILFWLLADRGVEALLDTTVTSTNILSAMAEAVRKASGIGRSPNMTTLLIKIR